MNSVLRSLSYGALMGCVFFLGVESAPVSVVIGVISAIGHGVGQLDAHIARART